MHRKAITVIEWTAFKREFWRLFSSISMLDACPEPEQIAQDPLQSGFKYLHELRPLQTSAGNLFQCSSSPTVKMFSLHFNGISYISFWGHYLMLTHGTTEKNLSPSSLVLPTAICKHWGTLYLKSHRYLQPVLIWQLLQTRFTMLMSLVLNSSALDAALQMTLTRLSREESRITSLSLLAALCLMQPKAVSCKRTLVYGQLVDTRVWRYKPGCFPGAWAYSFPSAGLGISPWWTL